MTLNPGQTMTRHMDKYRSIAVDYVVIHEPDGTQWTPIELLGCSGYYGRLMG